MFCDLVGSTELRDASIPRTCAVIRAYQRVASGAIHRFEGVMSP